MGPLSFLRHTMEVYGTLSEQVMGWRMKPTRGAAIRWVMQASILLAVIDTKVVISWKGRL